MATRRASKKAAKKPAKGSESAAKRAPLARAAKVPEAIARLFEEHPLARKAERDRAAGDLGYAARRYAARGENEGPSSPWWGVWSAIEAARGHALDEALETLTPPQRRGLALWAFATGKDGDGMAAYRRYLDAPGSIGPFDRENVLYLDRLAARGDHVAVVHAADEMIAKTAASPLTSLRAILALLELGDAHRIRARLPAPDASTVHDDRAWALYAIVCKKSGDEAGAREALAMCAKLGVREPDIEAALLAAMGLDGAAWEALRGTSSRGDGPDAPQKDPGAQDS